MLLQDRPKVLSKAVLQNRLWPDTFVAEANLSNLVAEIREALRDHAHAPTFIRTAHGFGYAFCGEAATLSGTATRRTDRPSCWLEWDRLRFPLAVGRARHRTRSRRGGQARRCRRSPAATHGSS